MAQAAHDTSAKQLVPIKEQGPGVQGDYQAQYRHRQ